jgi:hypothetical protein
MRYGALHATTQPDFIALYQLMTGFHRRYGMSEVIEAIPLIAYLQVGPLDCKNIAF